MNAHAPVKPVRHFLDLLDLPAEELRGILDASKSIKAARKAEPAQG